MDFSSSEPSLQYIDPPRPEAVVDPTEFSPGDDFRVVYIKEDCKKTQARDLRNE